MPVLHENYVGQAYYMCGKDVHLPNTNFLASMNVRLTYCVNKKAFR